MMPPADRSLSDLSQGTKKDLWSESNEKFLAEACSVHFATEH